jgi:hypothetical protein
MLNTVDLSESFYDPSAPYRDMAIDGKLTNAAETVKDVNSEHRTSL